MVLLRHLLGDVLRRLRQRQGRTLREVSALRPGVARIPIRGRGAGRRKHLLKLLAAILHRA